MKISKALLIFLLGLLFTTVLNPKCIMYHISIGGKIVKPKGGRISQVEVHVKDATGEVYTCDSRLSVFNTYRCTAAMYLYTHQSEEGHDVCDNTISSIEVAIKDGQGKEVYKSSINQYEKRETRSGLRVKLPDLRLADE